MLMPGTSLLVGMGKDHIFRVVDTSPGKMGEFNSTVDNDVQEFAGTSSPFFSSPVYWNSPNNCPVVYIWAPGDFLKGVQVHWYSVSDKPSFPRNNSEQFWFL